jgi:putative tricarboxylic transport membrane protein
MEYILKKANTAASVIGMAFSAYTCIVTFTFKQFENVPIGPDFFPRWLSIGLFICCFILFLENITSKSAGPSPTLSPKNKDMQRMLAGLASSILFAVLWNYVGFLIAAPLLIIAIQFLLGARKPLNMILYAVGLTVVTFAVFKFLLGIEMPLGFIDDLDI